MSTGQHLWSSFNLEWMEMFMRTSPVVDALHSGPIEKNKKAWKCGSRWTLFLAVTGKFVLTVKIIFHFCENFHPHKMIVVLELFQRDFQNCLFACCQRLLSTFQEKFFFLMLKPFSFMPSDQESQYVLFVND